MHALGYEHEQTRHDRNLYLQVLWQNIDPRQVHNFNKHPRTWAFPKFELDFRSVMMYPLTGFSIDPSKFAAMKVLVSKFIEIIL
jgi:Astacin (Peptidase family M12A)